MLKVAVISTVKAPLQELLMFVNYHLNIGIDEIILFFDNPNDGAITSLTHHNQVCAVECSSQYWSDKTKIRPNSIEERQIVNVNEGVQIATSKSCDWVVHIDSDELINPQTEIKEILRSCDAEALRFSILEAACEKEYYDNIFIPTLFKKKPSQKQIIEAKQLGCSNSIFDDEYFRGHLVSKMAIKINSNIGKIGIHGPEQSNSTITVKDTDKIRLLHYDCVGFDNWRLKWSRRLDGSGKAKRMRKNRNKQFQEFIQAYSKGKRELFSLYKRLHVIPDREKNILLRLGMLKKVKLDKVLFEKKSKENKIRQFLTQFMARVFKSEKKISS